MVAVAAVFCNFESTCTVAVISGILRKVRPGLVDRSTRTISAESLRVSVVNANTICAPNIVALDLFMNQGNVVRVCHFWVFFVELHCDR